MLYIHRTRFYGLTSRAAGSIEKDRLLALHNRTDLVVWVCTLGDIPQVTAVLTAARTLYTKKKSNIFGQCLISCDKSPDIPK